MESKTHIENTFSFTTRLKEAALGAVPAYIMPVLMAGLPGLLMDDARLAQASYTTIAIPSALAAFAIGFFLPGKWRGTKPPFRVGLLSGVVAGLVALLLGGLTIVGGLFELSILLDAVPSAFIGGGVAGFSSARKAKAANGTISTLTLALLVLPSCASAPPLPPPPIHFDVQRPPDVSAAKWSEFETTRESCMHRIQTLRANAEAAEDAASTSGVLSTSSGVLAVVAGTAGAIASSQVDDPEEALKVASIGGAAATAFGLGASVAGMYSGSKGEAAQESRAQALRLERRLNQSTFEVLSNRPSEPELARIAENLRRECSGPQGGQP